VKGDSDEEDEESQESVDMDGGDDSDDEFGGNDEFDDDDLNAAEFGDSSSDEEGDEVATGAKAFELMEKKAKKLAQKKKQIRKEAELEEKEQMERALEEEGDAEAHGFIFPTPEIMAKEKELGVDMSIIKSRFEETLRILDNFTDARDGVHTRKEYIQLLTNDLAFFYGYNNFLVSKFLQIFSPSEAAEFIQANEANRPLTVRVNTLKTRRGDLMKALVTRGVNLEPISWSKVAVQIFESSVPIGATPEYLAGHYMLQSASSMTAVVALEPQPDERVLDMCAAPGGKTTYIAQMMKNTGTLVANDVHPDRLKSLSANLHRLGVRNAIVTNYDGKEFPTVMGGFDRVLLDAPCTGTGVIARDASVKVSKSQEDIVKLGQTQRRLILAAIDSIDPNSPTGGILVYATCSITVEENEAIVDYALRKRFIKVLDSGMEFGKPGIVNWRHHRYNDQVKLARRYYPHVYNMDGFFICKIKKLANGVREKQDKKRKREEEDGEDDEMAYEINPDFEVEEQPEFEEISDDESSEEEQVEEEEEEEIAPAPPKKKAKISEQTSTPKTANGKASKAPSKTPSKSQSSKSTVSEAMDVSEPASAKKKSTTATTTTTTKSTPSKNGNKTEKDAVAVPSSAEKKSNKTPVKESPAARSPSAVSKTPSSASKTRSTPSSASKVERKTPKK
jgi:ribosomal RNA methyltransferase Nop2